ncbi:MAG: hypothetical protein NW226_03410 [Microscillaceae bacterium]|nr:hypothetical protein [Microscillaceae bacterium]
MGIIHYDFTLNNKLLSYPTVKDIIGMLEEKTHLKINFQTWEHIKTHVNGEKEKFIFQAIKGSDKIDEIIGLYGYSNKFSVRKAHPDYTYLFHSVIYLLTEITISYGGGELLQTFFSYDDTVISINSFENLFEFYKKINLDIKNIELAQYPFEIASKMGYST